ncbi:MAG: hypothetical protein IJB11_03340 [Oscillospiraceae bacterium]|nr:hypothetical protein [Oscillospiraceae bacterium]
MDIEILKELLSEYFVPVDSINWKQLLINVLPSVVAIITVIASTIVQLRSSKREMEKIRIQMEKQIELEHIRQEEFRRNAALEKQLENQQNIQNSRFAAYSKMIDTLYACSIETALATAMQTLRANTVELLSLCSGADSLLDAVRGLLKLIPTHVDRNTDCMPLLETLRVQAQIIGEQLLPPDFCSSTVERSEPTAQQ